MSVTGSRSLPLSEYCIGPKRTARDATELIASVTIPTARGPQEYLKVGPRNAMVISVAGLAAVPGVGRDRVKALIEEFGSVEALSSATVADLQRVPGVGRSTAQRVLEALR